jgi:hypothetical protein
MEHLNAFVEKVAVPSTPSKELSVGDSPLAIDSETKVEDEPVLVFAFGLPCSIFFIHGILVGLKFEMSILPRKYILLLEALGTNDEAAPTLQQSAQPRLVFPPVTPN